MLTLSLPVRILIKTEEKYRRQTPDDASHVGAEPVLWKVKCSLLIWKLSKPDCKGPAPQSFSKGEGQIQKLQSGSAKNPDHELPPWRWSGTSAHGWASVKGTCSQARLWGDENWCCCSTISSGTDGPRGLEWGSEPWTGWEHSQWAG